MTGLTVAIPVAAQKLLDAIASCTEETVWTRFSNGNPATYLHPDGKVVFKGVINPGDKRPDGNRWQGEKPFVFGGLQSPKNKPGTCDAHWFNLDILEVEAVAVVDNQEKIGDLVEL